MADASLRLGRWQEVLTDVGSVDVLATDPPYSERTHGGYRSGKDAGLRDQRQAASRILYDHITEAEIAAFVESWAPRVRSWSLVFGDHQSFVRWEAAWQAVGWVTFAPVLWLRKAAAPRFAGDGPTSAADYLCVARPRRRVTEHRSRPGFYLANTNGGYLCDSDTAGVVGVKDPVRLRELLTDYSRPGSLVADPFAGTATVGQACIEMGRRYVGSECDPDTHAKGLARLARSGPDPVLLDRWREPRRQTGFDFGSR